MTIQIDDLEEAIFLVRGLQHVRQQEQEQQEWCQNNPEEYKRRYGSQGWDIQVSIDNHKSSVEKIDKMLESVRKPMYSLTLEKAKAAGTVPPRVIDSMQSQVDNLQ